jgi:transcription-repair coupling factor (superfamily II helicase)
LTPEQVTIRVDPGAELPETFVPDTRLRLNLYRRLASFEDTREVSAFREEIRDRFGPLPPAAESVLKAADLRIRALAANVVSLRRHEEDVSIDFAEPADPSILLESVQHFFDSSALAYQFKNLRSGELRLRFHLQHAGQHDFLARFLDTLGT